MEKQPFNEIRRMIQAGRHQTNNCNIWNVNILENQYQFCSTEATTQAITPIPSNLSDVGKV